VSADSATPEPLELSAEDRRELERRGLDERELGQQLLSFREGFSPLELDRACTVGDGILRLSPSDHDRLLAQWESAAREGRLMKFVPASGAATRMFRAPLATLREFERLGDEELRRLEQSDDSQHRDTLQLLRELDRFAFAPALRASLKGARLDLDAILAGGDRRHVLEHLLEPPHLGLRTLAKGSIPFHRYEGATRTAFEEHVSEAWSTVRDAHGTIRVHFTVPPAQRERIEGSLRKAVQELAGPNVEAQLSFSVQAESTDTIAADPQNRPFRDLQGRLVFRPGGHGALLHNLDGLDADVVLIRNIDNVAIEAQREPTVLHERLLVGLTIDLQRRIHQFLASLDDDTMTKSQFEEARRWCENVLGASLPEKWARRLSEERRRQQLRFLLDRPLRVCAMVRNEGEPGGGPFWVRHVDGTVTKQIVESSQVNADRRDQQDIFTAATHFNPVDLVCTLRDASDKPFSLEGYVDPRRVFIAQKSYEGRPLKALERPGLWNGAMAHWNTVFVEVPIETFNPVKTVLDLLRPAHQPG
jgi:hypothetical protein